MKILSKVDLYRPMTLRKHLHIFCSELVDKKKRAEKSLSSIFSQVRWEGVKPMEQHVKVKKYLGGTGKFKDRSGLR